MPDGPHDPPICPACSILLSQHMICAACRCFTHANVQVRHDPAICRTCDKALAARGVRRCKDCGAIKSLDRFDRVKGRWYRRQCKTCMDRQPSQRAYQKKWHARHRERRNAVQRERYRANPEKWRTWRKAWYQRHRERFLAYLTDDYRKRPEVQERRREWLEANSERVRAKRQERRARSLLRVLRGGAS